MHLGVISKVVMHDQLTIFVKTDASLFNGFSGCGIWDKERAGRFVGMAVFILKHKHSLLSYHKQNFSYSSEFIAHMLRDSHDDELVHN